MIRTASVHATRSARAAAVRGAQSGAGVPARALADSAQGGDPAPEHESFVRGMFRGEMKEASVFPYPDVLTEEQSEAVSMMLDPVTRFFEEVNDAGLNDAQESVPEHVTKGLAELGAFGLQVPEELHGVGLNNTQYARMVEVVGAHDLGVGIFLGAHQSIGFKGILIAGNEEQKAKYLPKLATAEQFAAFALTEPSSGSDANSIRTRATLSEDGKNYVLNGSKIWISNGGFADVFTVFAQTQVEDKKTGEMKDKVTAFIVERGFGGVTSGPPEKKMGIKCSNTAEVHFEDTVVPVENVIGEVGGGFKVAMNILNNGRFGMVAVLSGTCKQMIKLAAEHAISRNQFDRKIKDFGTIQKKFAQMSARTYASESLAYLISSNMDRGSQDYQLEAAIGKIFASETAWYVTDEAIQVMGGLGYMKEYPFERFLRDLRIFRIFEGTNDILRLFVGLTGMQSAGEKLKDAQKAMKNPFGNFGALAELGSKQLRSKLGLSAPAKAVEGAHPSLVAPAAMLAQQSANFNTAVENLLMKHGKGIMEEQMMTIRVADAAIDLYAMAAVTSRASRALEHNYDTAEHEASLATAFCTEANMRITENLRQMREPDGVALDSAYENVAKQVFEQGHYFARHPIGV